MEILPYLITGAVAGLMAGLLGIGGGLVIVPALAFLFSRQGFPGETLMHFAVGTSLATIVVTSTASLLAHHRRASVDWRAVRRLTPGILAGALGGAWLARQTSSPALATVFGLFEILVALQLLSGARPAAHRVLPGRAALMMAGGVIGAVSALLGIGGGTLTVPYLLWHRVDIRAAVGTAAACGLPVALAGAAGFALGDGDGTVPGPQSGFIDWPAAGGIVLASALAAPAGARLAHHLPRRILRLVFAGFLLLVGVKMILGV
ncbi:MAG: sulfite exporter TauE/SafE family protein [Gammaproteobacteria bacterium]|jgi:uncharacterized membrane protein YfcA